jgi:hypothetical protein
MEKNEPFYIFLYVFECPREGCKTPVVYTLKTAVGEIDKSLELACDTCGQYFLKEPREALYTYAITYKDRTCSPFHTQDKHT